MFGSKYMYLSNETSFVNKRFTQYSLPTKNWVKQMLNANYALKTNTHFWFSKAENGEVCPSSGSLRPPTPSGNPVRVRTGPSADSFSSSWLLRWHWGEGSGTDWNRPPRSSSRTLSFLNRTFLTPSQVSIGHRPNPVQEGHENRNCEDIMKVFFHLRVDIEAVK